MSRIVWPVYIDSTKSRKEGRKISKEFAVKTPKLSEIIRSARKLNFNPIIEENKSFPGSWYEYSGRVLIDNGDLKKNEALINISKTISSLRNK
ncbi:signal recognition particle subunit SRP19/SEC65 family protein [Methanobrevibacter curvatus]|uniref:Signal recognition particle 19 kDa protein n=1 Tax=Methanobrevibacter curvatus TaxID=49547 RepID=A0A165Z734_9EURY|nr:signal recognition particle subunit SRP19/SEC65 family protein [Methanobrevibacter curvatus]KZX10332.1 signal recognition particle protein Srp19 [Methanobrevibacter curvatus]